LHRSFRKPLVIMAPKSMLRNKSAVSSISDFTGKCFKSILSEQDPAIASPNRVILCSGKLYYELLEYRKQNEKMDTAIVRVEQFYPFNRDLLTEILKPYGKFKSLIWCQEEPENMGAWTFLRPILEETTGRQVLYAGRDEAASTAVGSLAAHKIEQSQLIEDAFTIN
jgi:2-oxoglutarate dehydrogenase E1 component